MPEAAVRIGPGDHGRRMTLEEFDRADGQPGHLYELSRGVVTVVDVPNPRHLAQVNAIRRQLAAYDLSHEGQIHAIAGGGECKILLAGSESERHPDVAVYKTPPPEEEEDVWAGWVPEVVIEVVSPGSEKRDYVEKREEYLLFGVLEYWILDEGQRRMLVLRRSRGRWTDRNVVPPEVYRTRLLPGLEFACATVFAAAEAAGA
jgi:Uma2 family endonuclease